MAEIDTIHNTSLTQEIDTYSLELRARMQSGGLLFDQFFNFPIGNAAVQTGITQAQGVLAGAGAVAFLGPALLSNVQSLVSSVPNVVQNKILANVIIGTAGFFWATGGTTLLIGDSGFAKATRWMRTTMRLSAAATAHRHRS